MTLPIRQAYQSRVLIMFSWVSTLSLRDELVKTIAYALNSNRKFLRAIIKSHTADDESKMAAEKIVQQLKLSGYQVTKGKERRRHSTP